MKKVMLYACAIGLIFASCTEEAATDANATDGTTPAATEGTATDATDPAATTVDPSAVTNTETADPAAPTGPATTMEFSETEHNFGTIQEGEVVKHTFTFTNTGSEPLIISNAKGSCGCTVPYYPKNPIPPGGTDQIEVSFDSKGKKGTQRKSVTITANTDPNTTVLNIVSEVEGGAE